MRASLQNRHVLAHGEHGIAIEGGKCFFLVSSIIKPMLYSIKHITFWGIKKMDAATRM